MEAKKEFQFYFDEKCTIWTRTSFCVEADTYEEAEKLSLELIENGEFGNNGSSEYETLYDTINGMTPFENGNNPTFEVYNDKHERIKHNGHSTFGIVGMWIDDMKNGSK